MNVEDKVNALNLVSITEAEKQKLDQYFSDAPDGWRDYSRWDFVRWYQEKPYFYSKAYLEQHTLDELERAFAALISP